MKRKTGLFGVFGLALLVLSLSLAACDNGTSPGGGGDGWLSFSDNWPTDVLTNEDFSGAYVIANDSVFADEDALEDVPAVAYCSDNFSDWVDQPGKKLQFHVPSSGKTVGSGGSSSSDPAWTGSDTYTVVLEVNNKSTYSTTYYTKKDVSFTNGGASVNWSDFAEVAGNPSPPSATNYTVSANGAANTTATTALTLTFTSAVSGLSAADITLTNNGGEVSKGTLTGSGTTWTLVLTTTKAGSIKVKITKSGINSSDHAVTVHYPGGGPLPPAGTLVGTWTKTGYSLTFTGNTVSQTSGAETTSGTYTHKGTVLSITVTSPFSGSYSGTASVSGSTLIISGFDDDTELNGTYTKSEGPPSSGGRGVLTFTDKLPNINDLQELRNNSYQIYIIPQATIFDPLESNTATHPDSFNLAIKAFADYHDEISGSLAVQLEEAKWNWLDRNQTTGSISSSDNKFAETGTFKVTISDEYESVYYVLDNVSFTNGNASVALSNFSLNPPPVGTTYRVSANGTANSTATTALTLTFASAVSGLSADDITLTNNGGAATKGTLTGSETTWTLNITTTTTGNIKVKITKSGIIGSDHPVLVHYYSGQ
jgi:hypothetical protein